MNIYRQTHHQHSSHTNATGHHGSGGSQSTHIDSKYTDNVNGHDTLTDFVTFVCQETDNGPQSSQVINNCFFFSKLPSNAILIFYILFSIELKLNPNSKIKIRITYYDIYSHSV